mgnify:CR=1 FL=1
MVKVRFAPSPTGYLHIGGARTALFNWLYARSQNGKFVLRIEDTDQVRSKKEFEDEILQSMKWLGLDWDELYYQSKRFDIYRKYAEDLLSQGKAYKDGEAIILKMPPNQSVKIHDLIRDEIVFDSSELKDQVLLKSDGSPTYSFACVVDDALMEITCVIRGEDHISNTPKQFVIYQALGFKPPKFAHLPLIMGEEGGRMSKRHGAVAVSDYKKEGFLPEAIVNYLMLLGWSPGNNQEVVALQTAIKNFSIKKINKAAAAFSMDKLEWINSQYIKKADNEKLVDLVIPFLKEKGYIQDGYERNKLLEIVKLYKGRLSTLTDLLEWADFVFVDKLNYDLKAREEHLSVNKKREFELLKSKLSSINSFDVSETEKAFRELVSELNIQSSELVHPIRVALTGRAVGPGLFETMAVLGKEKTLKRLEEAFA